MELLTQTLELLFSVLGSLVPNDPENHSCNKNWDRVEDVEQVVAGRLAEIESDRVHYEEDHIVVVVAAGNTGADSH